MSAQRSSVPCLMLFCALASGHAAWAAGDNVQMDASQLLMNMGNAPLVGAPDHNAVMRRQRIALNADALDSVKTGDRLAIDLFADSAFQLRVDRVMKRSNDRAHMFGKLVGQPESNVVLVRNGDRLTGIIQTDSLASYRVMPLADGGHVVMELDPAGFGGCVSAGDGGGGGGGGPAPMGDPPPGYCDEQTQIDVIAFYTPDARDDAGGTAQIEAEIDLAIAAANNAYDNSGINTQLNLLFKGLITYDESGSYSDHLYHIADPDNGIMDEAHTVRDALNADLVSLFVADAAYCGIAYILPSTTTAWSPIGFNVNTWFCAAGNLTLAHEVGHNLGACHDHDNCGSGGIFDYSWGHRYTGDSTTLWRTVMSYSPGTRIPYFSNPDVLYDGQPTGVEEGFADEADNARTINETALTVANYRCAGVPDPTTFVFQGEYNGDQFGRAVANAGDIDNDGMNDIIVGAPNNDDNGDKAGKIYVYSGRTGVLLYTKTGQNAGDRFGWSVSTAGDANGDGYDDFLVGAPYYDYGNKNNAGRVYLYSGLAGLQLHAPKGDNSGDRFGYDVSGGVDIDNDGHDDFIVGAPWNDDAGGNAGTVYAYSGKTHMLIDTVSGDDNGDKFGWSVAVLNKVNSDAWGDFAVGAPFNDDKANNAGKVSVYSGKNFNRLYSKKGYKSGDKFGHALAAVGRVDDDNRTDFIVGAPFWDKSSASNAGRADVFSGNSGQKIHTRKGSNTNDRLGWGVGAGGDMDDDGFDDFAIGITRDDDAGEDAGSAIVRSDNGGGTLGTIDGDDAGDNLGWAVDSLGDLDGDDLDDLIIGSPFNDDAGSNSGQVYLYLTTAPPADLDAPLGGGDDSMPGDLNSDERVDFDDLSLLLAAWGACADPADDDCPADLNVDGNVDVLDLVLLLDEWN